MKIHQEGVELFHILPYVACTALKYFSTLSHKGHYFRKQKLFKIKSVF